MSNPIFEIYIDVSDLEKLVTAIPEMQEVIRDEMEKAMDESGMLLTSLVAANTPVNYGLLRSSIQWPSGYELQNNTLDLLRGIVGASQVDTGTGVSTSEYVDFVEHGTLPHWTPIAPLKLYAIRKFGNEQAAYAIQVHIAWWGTRGAHMFEEGWKSGEPKVEEIWNKVPVRVVQQFERIAL